MIRPAKRALDKTPISNIKWKCQNFELLKRWNVTYSWRTPFCIFGGTHFVEMGSSFVDSVTRFVVLEQPFVDSVTHFVVLEQPDGKFYKLPLMRGKKPGTPQPHPSQNNDHPLLQLWLGWYHSVYCGTGCKHMMTYGLATRKSDFAPGTENGRKDSNVQ